MPDDKVTRRNQESGVQRLDLADVQTRRRHMLPEEAVLEWNSYTPRASALCASLVSLISGEAGVSLQPDTFNTSVDDQFPDDVILLPTVLPDTSAIKARWTNDHKVVFYFERLLKKRPINIPVGMKAFLTFSRYQKENLIGIRVHLSSPRFAAIVKTGPKKKTAGDQMAAGQLPEEEPPEE